MGPFCHYGIEDENPARGFDKIVGNDFEQHRVSDAGPEGVGHREVPRNPSLSANHKKSAMDYL